MSRSLIFGLVAASFAFICLTADRSLAQGEPGQAGQRPRMMCQDRFVSMDTNKDGKVEKTEFMAVTHPGVNPEEIFKSRDANADGSLSKEEFCAGKGMRGGRAQ
jgi:hypothetical protein